MDRRAIGIALGIALMTVWAVSLAEGDPDLGWRVVIGRYVLETGSIPSHAVRAAVPEGVRWGVNDWVGEVIFALVYDRFGIPGAAVTRIVAITLLGLLSFFGARRRSSSILAAAFTTLLMLSGADFRFGAARSFLFGYLFLAGFVAFVSVTRKWTPLRLLAAFAIQVAWTQTHGNAILGPIITGALLTSALLATVAPRRLSTWTLDDPPPQVSRLALLFGCVLVGACTGHLGVNFVLQAADPGHTAWMAADLQNAEFVEWRPTTAELIFGEYPRVGFSAFTLGSLGVWGAVSRPRIALFELFLVAGMAVIGMAAIRFWPEALIVMALIAARPVAELARKRSETHRTAILAGAVACAALVWSAGVALDRLPRFAFRARHAWYPDAAVRAMRDVPPGLVCNSFNLGGYLLMELPNHQTYIDGRLISIYSPEHYRAQMKALRSPSLMRAFAEENDVVACVISYPGPKEITAFDSETWALIQVDDVSASFVRRSKVTSKWLDAHELRTLDPRHPFDQIAAAAEDDALAAALKQDLERALALTEDRFLLTMWQSKLARARGDTVEADRLRAEAGRIFPGPESMRMSFLSPETFDRL